MINKLNGPIYNPILHEIKAMPHVRVINHGMADNKGYDKKLAEIVVGFDTMKKHGWRGVLLGETEPILNLKDIERHIQRECGYEPTSDNDRRLFYKIKEKGNEEKKLYFLEISITPLFI